MLVREVEVCEGTVTAGEDCDAVAVAPAVRVEGPLTVETTVGRLTALLPPFCAPPIAGDLMGGRAGLLAVVLVPLALPTLEVGERLGCLAVMLPLVVVVGTTFDVLLSLTAWVLALPFMELIRRVPGLPPGVAFK